MSHIPSKVIFVYSGKGGVGKSTFSVNLAYALSKNGIKVGLFDADLCTPNVPLMVRNIENTKPKFDNFLVAPGNYHGVKINSIGFFSDPVEGGYWNNKYIDGILHQLLFESDWGNIDILVVDMPPGIGEIHKKIFRRVKGKVILITTPQDVSYSDVARGIEILNRLGIDIIGIVENMSYHICDCGRKIVFNGDTKKSLCDPYKLDLLLEMPMSSEISNSSNEGIPFALSNRELAGNITSLAKKIFDDFDSFKSIRPTI